MYDLVAKHKDSFSREGLHFKAYQAVLYRYVLTQEIVTLADKNMTLIFTIFSRKINEKRINFNK